MVLRRFAWRLGGEGDAETAPVGVGLLGQDGDPGRWHERRQGHATEPRLVGLKRR